jgi:crotonobetainyl-CoA:carnitine CoA-transferase CaiB-like acyl-CoA transferase
LALNLRSEAGPALLRRLAAEVDVVVENFSPGTLEKWGLGWDELRKINPAVVLVSMAGVGATGPWRNAVTFADTLAAMSGLTYETGVEGRDPQGLTFGLGDMVAANAATLATLEHLLRGGGAHVDLSQLEAMAAHLGTALLDATLPREEPAGRDKPKVLRVAGTDRWVAVGATSRERLTAVVEELAGQPVDDPMATLEQVAGGWEADELAAALQARGVAAYPVRDGRDLVTLDPQLTARSFYPTQHHPLVGDVQVEGVVAHLSDTPPSLRSPAPLLGEHTDELLEEVLGLDHQQIRQLRDQGALE